MILNNSASTIDFNKMECIPECDAAFPVACYEYDLRARTEPWHWHDELEATIIVSGRARFLLEGEEYLLNAGDGYFVNANALHSLLDFNNEHCLIRCVVFKKEIVGGYANSVFWHKYVLPVVGRQDFFGAVLTPVKPEQAAVLRTIEEAFGQCRYERDCEPRVRELLTGMLSLVAKGINQSQTSVTRAEWGYIAKIKGMLLYIWLNYSAPVTLDLIAAAGRVSKNECLLCFRKTVAISPIQYLKNYRLQKAADALRLTKKQVADIAESCGFPDKSYFTKAFVSKFGVSPLQYRRAAVKDE